MQVSARRQLDNEEEKICHWLARRFGEALLLSRNPGLESRLTPP